MANCEAVKALGSLLGASSRRIVDTCRAEQGARDGLPGRLLVPELCFLRLGRQDRGGALQGDHRDKQAGGDQGGQPCRRRADGRLDPQGGRDRHGREASGLDVRERSDRRRIQRKLPGRVPAPGQRARLGFQGDPIRRIRPALSLSSSTTAWSTPSLGPGKARHCD